MDVVDEKIPVLTENNDITKGTVYAKNRGIYDYIRYNSKRKFGTRLIILPIITFIACSIIMLPALLVGSIPYLILSLGLTCFALHHEYKFDLMKYKEIIVFCDDEIYFLKPDDDEGFYAIIESFNMSEVADIETENQKVKICTESGEQRISDIHIGKIQNELYLTI